MTKIFILNSIFLIFLSSCSIDTNSEFWDSNKNKLKKKITELKFDYSLSYDEFKNNIIEYGQKSKFPILDK